MLHLESGHPDAHHPLLIHAARVLIDRGAEVVLHTGDDNLVRSRRPEDPGSAPFIVAAAGVPNLLHELVHVVQVGRLADDHGIDYGQIPYDLARAPHRQILWQELTCCVVSCAYLDAAHEAAWFAEQVGIQGIFYGHDDDPEGFLNAVDRSLTVHRDELEATLARGYAATEDRLRAAGAPEPLATPRARLDVLALWTPFRARSQR